VGRYTVHVSDFQCVQMETAGPFRNLFTLLPIHTMSLKMTVTAEGTSDLCRPRLYSIDVLNALMTQTTAWRLLKSDFCL
jgi:hypothetical protein